MPRSRHEVFRVQALQMFDALLVWLAFLIAWELRELIRIWIGMGIESENARETIHWVLYITVPLTPIILERFGFYRQLRSKTTQQTISQLIKALAVITVTIALFAVFAKYTETRRLVLGLGIIGVGALLLLRDRAITLLLRRNALLSSTKERVLFVGSAHATQELYNEIDPEITEGWLVVNHFDLESQPVEDLYFLIKQESVARVIFAAKGTGFDRVTQAVEACEVQGVEAWISASFIRSQIARPSFDAIGNTPMLVLRSTPDLSWELLFKEIFDRITAAFLILVTSPLWLIAAMIIRVKSPGAPVFFSQMRAGRYGKPFRMWKFRTMVSNAEALLDQIKKDHGNHMDGPVFKLDRDPRIIPYGAILRKFSIDELPQLINVLRGDMSLVGPRPLPLYEVEAFSDVSHRRRLSVKPGITCEWQVGGRNHITNFDEWVEMDLRYIDNWSLWLDFVILLRTIPAVLFGKGAQ